MRDVSRVASPARISVTKLMQTDEEVGEDELFGVEGNEPGSPDMVPPDGIDELPTPRDTPVGVRLRSDSHFSTTTDLTVGFPVTPKLVSLLVDNEANFGAGGAVSVRVVPPAGPVSQVLGEQLLDHAAPTLNSIFALQGAHEMARPVVSLVWPRHSKVVVC